MPPELPADGPARDNRQVIRLVQLRPEAVLPVLARAVDCFAEALRADLRIGFARDGTAMFVLPHWNERPYLSQSEVTALSTQLADAMTRATGWAAPRPADPCSMNLAPMADIGDAAMIALRNTAQPCGAGSADAESGDSRRLAVVAGDDETVAHLSADVLRRGRHAGVSAVARLPNGEQAVLLHLEDDAEAGSTLAGLRALVGGGGVLQLLHPVETAGGTLYLPEGETLLADALVDAGRVLRALRALGRIGAEDALALFGASRDQVMALPVAPPSGPAQPAAPAALPIDDPGIVLHVLAPLPAAEAGRALQEKIAARAFPVGYRVRLAAQPESRADDGDIEELRARIAEIEEKIEFLQTFAAPQLRLLRFSEAQLPALVDGIRRMPPAMQRDGRIGFTSAHASGRAGPAHFMLYDPAEVALDGMLPEHYWRGATEDRPIVYALDPFAAVALQEAPEAPLVFVPRGRQLLPAIRNFGGDLAGNLRLVLGNLFASAEAVLGRPGARPAFVFSPSSDPDFELEVELIDAAEFAPLQVQIKWINDHMRLRAPVAANAERVAALAETLYEGEVVQVVRDEVENAATALEDAWTEAAAALTEHIVGLEAQLSDEVEAVGERARLAVAFLEAAATRIVTLDVAVDRMRKVLQEADTVSDRIAHIPAGLETRWLDSLGTFDGALAASDRMLAEADARIRQRHETIARLRREWERL